MLSSHIVYNELFNNLLFFLFVVFDIFVDDFGHTTNSLQICQLWARLFIKRILTIGYGNTGGKFKG